MSPFTSWRPNLPGWTLTGWALRATSSPAASRNRTSIVPCPGSSARQRMNTMRWGERVIGGGDGAAMENITPVRSKRVDGPGT